MLMIHKLVSGLMLALCAEYVTPQPPPVSVHFVLPITMPTCLKYVLRSGETMRGWEFQQPLIFEAVPDATNIRIAGIVFSNNAWCGG